MAKRLYDYVLFYANDLAQIPIDYKSIKELSIMFDLSTKTLHNRFNENNILYFGEYGVERFRRDNE